MITKTVESNRNNNKKFSLNKWSNRARKIKNNGYIYIYYKQHPHSDKEGWIAEHRLIMENYLDKYLESYEHIHHINGKKLDNRIENLELHTASTHYKRYHEERRKIKRICVRCGTNRPPLSKKRHKDYFYYYPRWHRNPLNKIQWTCESCYKKIRKGIMLP